MMIRYGSMVVAALLLVACGGASSAPDEPVAAPPVVEQPVVEAPAAPTRPEMPEYMFHVYWDGIHVLTVYPVAGVIRSEERGNNVPPYGEHHEEFSLISHYYERENMWAPMIEAASDVDDLLRRLGDVDLVEIDEVLNEPQEL